MPGLRILSALLLALQFSVALAASHKAASRVTSAPVPPEMRSTGFSVTVDGQPVDVAHAAASYDYASFDITGPVTVGSPGTELEFAL